jgi:hypothetical protein
MRPPQQAQIPLKEVTEIRRPNQYRHHQHRVQNGPSFNMLSIAPVLWMITAAYWNSVVRIKIVIITQILLNSKKLSGR